VILVGELSLWVAMLMAAWATTVSFAGAKLRRDDLIVSGQRAVYATFVMVVLASIGLWTALFTHDFSLAYVANTTSANMPTAYVIAAFWGGQPGSMLFWVLILSGYSAIAVFTSRDRNRDLVPYVAGTLAAVTLFFVATTAFKANPFERVDWVPADGRGMNPQLQNPGMALHPPNLYLGYVGTTVPFAFAIAALFLRRLDTEWLAAVRRWSLLSWFFLTIGIVLGMWWAYVELGWGGYWMWDPVENVSFLPWLACTAFLHSIMIQEKRGMLRKWNVVLVVMTFNLSIFGTFITRSGIIESVHSFARSPVGWWFGAFFVFSTAFTIYMVATRLRDIEAKVELESMVSREAAFLYNNLLLMGLLFAILWGTLFPILSEWATGTKITVGPPWFNSVNVPLGLLLLALTGIGPLIAWRKASLPNLKRQFAMPAVSGIVAGAILFALGMRSLYPLVTYTLCGFVSGTIIQEFVKGVSARRAIHGEGIVRAFTRLVLRNRRRYGGYIVHAGIVMLFVAFAGYLFKVEDEVTMGTTDVHTTRDPYGRQWRFVSQGLSSTKSVNAAIVSAVFEVWREGERVGFLRSEKRTYFDTQGRAQFEPATEVGILSSPKQDVYLVYTGGVDQAGRDCTGRDPSMCAAVVRISFFPLVMWVWIGGAVMAIGGLIVMWPQAERARRQSGYVTVIPAGGATEPAAVVG
jgi:cytochrome c-type biogenesis protein CcmF